MYQQRVLGNTSLTQMILMFTHIQQQHTDVIMLSIELLIVHVSIHEQLSWFPRRIDPTISRNIVEVTLATPGQLINCSCLQYNALIVPNVAHPRP